MLGTLLSLLNPLLKLKDSVFGNKENTLARATQENMAASAQYVAGFTRTGGTWWDSLWDGLNRAPQPILALYIVFLLILPAVEPARFVDMMQGYILVPEGMWVLVGIVVTFYFGGRLQVKSQDFKINAQALAQAHQQAIKISEVEFQKELRDTTKPLSNAAILEYNRRMKE